MKKTHFIVDNVLLTVFKITESFILLILPKKKTVRVNIN